MKRLRPLTAEKANSSQGGSINAPGGQHGGMFYGPGTGIDGIHIMASCSTRRAIDASAFLGRTRIANETGVICNSTICVAEEKADV
jgi:hypothetical protein